MTTKKQSLTGLRDGRLYAYRQTVIEQGEVPIPLRSGILRRMRVRVLLFGVLKERGGSGELEVELQNGARVADVLSWAMDLVGDDRLLLGSAVAVNRVYAAKEMALNDGDEVALLPPVSGGYASHKADV